MDLDDYINKNLELIFEQSVNETAPTLQEELDETEDLMFENAEIAHELAGIRADADLSKHELEYRQFFSQDEGQETANDLNIEHLFSLLNIFTKYYNEKFDRVENYFTGIHENNEMSQMGELFLEATFEYTRLMEHFDIEDNPTMMKMYYSETDTKIVQDILEKSEMDLYQCEIRGKNPHKIYSLSLLVCLNYVLENGYDGGEWYVFTLTPH